MKKVVINNCFGGFSLSAKAVKRLAELQGRPCYLFTSSFKDSTERFTPATVEECGNSFMFDAFTIPDPNKLMARHKDWHEMTKDEKDEWNKLYTEVQISSRPENREDPLLIQVVEELGEDADGQCADLKIVEIPDDVEYEITEYDGNEHIAETHRTWY